MGYANISPAMWDEKVIYSRSDNAVRIWFYLLTGAEAMNGIPGLVQGGIATFADGLRKSPIDIEAGLRELESCRLIFLDLGFRLVRVPKAPKHRPPGNPNILKGWFNKWRTLPDSPLKFEHVESLSKVGRRSDAFRLVWESTFGDSEVQQLIHRNAFERDSKGFLTGEKASQSLSLFDTTTKTDDDQKPSRSLREGVDQDRYQDQDQDQDRLPPQPPGAPSQSPAARPAAPATAASLWQLQEELRAELGMVPCEATPDRLALVTEALKDFRPAELEHALRVDAQASRNSSESARYFNGTSNWKKGHLRISVRSQLSPGGYQYANSQRRTQGGSALG